MKMPSLKQAGADLNAGLLVALVGIPQCLAYAMLSGLPPMYGLATAAIPGMVAAILGRSAWVTVGPTNTTGLIILSSLTPFAALGLPTLLYAMAILTLLAGLVRLLIAYGRFSRIFDFIPEAVMVGFATGAAIIIALMQFDDFLGVSLPRADGPLQQLWLLEQALVASPELSWPTLVVALGSLLLVQVGRKWLPQVPVSLVLLSVVVLLVMLTDSDFERQLVLLGDQVETGGGWPQGVMPIPSLESISQLVLPAFAVAFIGSLELIVILRNNQQSHLLNAELKSQGWANVAGSFFSAFPASTSLTRSVLLEQGGAKTRLAPFIAGVTLVPLIFWGADIIAAIPIALIAALLMSIAISMIKPRQIKVLLRANMETRMLFLVTVFSTILLPFHEAILVGTLLGMSIFLYQSSKPRLERFGVDEQKILVPYRDHKQTVITVSGSLFFAAAKALPDRIVRLLSDSMEFVILDLSQSHHMRFTAAQSLQSLITDLTQRDLQVSIIGLSSVQKRTFERMGFQFPFADDYELERRLIPVTAEQSEKD